jgi:chemotaxis protein MotB
MSLRRKKYDGDIFGRSAGAAERRNSFGTKSKTEQYSTSKQSKKRIDRFKLAADIYYEDSTKDRYLLTYADLITLLLALFIILYAISNVDNLKYKEITKALGSVFGNKGDVVGLEDINTTSGLTPNEKLKQELTALVEDYNTDNSLQFEEDKRGIVIHILDKMLFASGESEISVDSRQVLKGLAEILKKLPNDIRIEGHTDNVPISSIKFPSNWHLSVSRALNTAYYLISVEKLSPDKVSIVGYAEYKPIYTNDTPSGRSINRRVDIVILNKN